jgi:hypothetical protein
MAFVGLEPQWYIAQRVVFTTRAFARCWKPTATYSPYFCLACVINIQHIASHKMTFVGLEPQLYIAQSVQPRSQGFSLFVGKSPGNEVAVCSLYHNVLVVGSLPQLIQFIFV